MQAILALTVSCVLDAGAVMCLLFLLFLTEKSNNSFHLASIKSPLAPKRLVMHINQR